MAFQSVRIANTVVMAGATIVALSNPVAARSSGAEPERIGQCVATRVTKVGTRLDSPGSGSAIAFANGVSQISYDQVAAVDRSRTGDPVVVCLVSKPTNCPSGDHRGRVYATTNRRTGASWRMANASHTCGGA